mmetsp:Transcript_5446/g.16783  ORF Transcript_5446/g.16783 Transcript_5446/m.16783 type:complete len:413 (+) Transcript_5446:305-1543(+)
MSTASQQDLKQEQTEPQRAQEQWGAKWLSLHYPEIEARFSNAKTNEVIVFDLRAKRGVDAKRADVDGVVAAATKHSRKPLHKLVRHFEKALDFPASYGESALKRILNGAKGVTMLLFCVGDSPEEAELPDYWHSVAGITVETAMRTRSDILEKQRMRDAGVESTPQGDMEFTDVHRNRSKCGHCGSPSAKLSCAACEQVRYCDRSCQKAHWPSHKGPCKKRREATARLEEMNRRMGSMTTGHDTTKLMSDDAIEALGTEEQQEVFLQRFDEFKSKFVEHGFLSDIAFKARLEKFTGSFGDDAETCARKGRALTRKIRIHLDHSDYLDFVQRRLQKRGGKVNLAIFLFDDSDVPDMIKNGMVNKTCAKMYGDIFDQIDPKTHFIFTLTDRNLGPMVDATILVPWEWRRNLRKR